VKIPLVLKMHNDRCFSAWKHTKVDFPVPASGSLTFVSRNPLGLTTQTGNAHYTLRLYCLFKRFIYRFVSKEKACRA